MRHHPQGHGRTARSPRAWADGDDVLDKCGPGASAYAHSLTLIAEATDEIVRIARG